MFSFRRVFSSGNGESQKDFESDLRQVKEIGQTPQDLDFHRVLNVPKSNITIALNDMALTVWDIYSLKKKRTYPTTRLVFASQNITLIESQKLIIVTLRSHETSIFSFNRNLRLICKAPVAEPYTEYIPSLKAVVSFGDGLLSIWGLYNRKVYYKGRGSFKNVKYLTGLDKIATFEGLFCELHVYDIDKEKKALINKKLLFSNDSTYGNLNSLEWIEGKNLLIMSDSVLGTIKIFSCREGKRWDTVATIEKPGDLLHPVRVSTEMMLATWKSKGEDNSYLIELKKMKTHELNKKVSKICFCSPDAKKFVTCHDNTLSLWKF